MKPLIDIVSAPIVLLTYPFEGLAWVIVKVINKVLK
jgi:hypothetical protein